MGCTGIDKDTLVALVRLGLGFAGEEPVVTIPIFALLAIAVVSVVNRRPN